ncbi:hypothetical protein IV203_015165 [Nitzschia inconspicua]|uniref:Uncharacterized protein n=1 Tax=Nitzschia inconspicua TaxID=303405 RepID=A0A9K3LDA1_9STRA|nr:hypothetical protein IV203_015165 [Nitzschia inconspicua]
MAELMFGLGQTKKKKETEAKIKQSKAEEWNYKGRIDQDGMILERKEKANREQKWKEEQRTTRKNLKDVTQGETGEMAIRKEQHTREQKWKETGRNQVKSNTNFDMARSLFGGGGPAPRADNDEEEAQVDKVSEKVETTTLETEDVEPVEDEISYEEGSQDEEEYEEEEK